jgi:hypothetical protein
MSLQEKCALITGQDDGFHTAAIERLGIPSVRMADGPQGVRNKTNSTYYPCGISLAASFNREIAHGVGTGIGWDASARGVRIMLCPGVNIYRSPLCGRNFEYYGEDPYLSSETAVQYIRGIQEQRVIATIKHFALNNQEYDRHWTASVADERTINEIYFPAFRKAVEEARVGAVMTSYNPVNGSHASESNWLISHLRRWGHEGIVMSDWVSTYTTIGCLLGGLDLEMPGPAQYFGSQLADAVRADDASRVLVLGDLNTSTEDRSFAPLSALLRDAQADAGWGFGLTWPSALPVLRPDQVLYRGLTATDKVVAKPKPEAKTGDVVSVDAAEPKP